MNSDQTASLIQAINQEFFFSNLPTTLATLASFKPTLSMGGNKEIQATLSLLDGLEFNSDTTALPCLKLRAYKGNNGLVFSASYALVKREGYFISSQSTLFEDFYKSLPAIKARCTDKALIACWQAGLDSVPALATDCFKHYGA